MYLIDPLDVAVDRVYLGPVLQRELTLKKIEELGPLRMKNQEYCSANYHAQTGTPLPPRALVLKIEAQIFIPHFSGGLINQSQSSRPQFLLIAKYNLIGETFSYTCNPSI